MTCQVYLRDAAYRRIAEIEFESLKIVRRHLGISTWELTVDLSAIPSFDWGVGIIVEHDYFTFSGPMTTRKRERAESGESTLVLNGMDDTVWLARRLALPAASPYTASEYDTRTGVAETVMHAYVNANLGPGAAAARRIGLTMGADQGRGSSVNYSARFHPLLEVCQQLALRSTTELGFRIVQVGETIEFRAYQPATQPSVIFGDEMGNLAAYTYEESVPEANYVIVGGQGEGTARTFTEGSDATSVATFGRIEAFVDRRDTNDATELAQARAEELTERAYESSLKVTPVDTERIRYGRDYDVGDKVTVEADGTDVVDVVREVTLNIDADGVVVEPSIASPGTQAPGTPKLFAALSRQARRLARQERK